MEQPLSFIDMYYPTHVRKLQKAIYELKQVSQAWFNKLASTLIGIGFSESKVDYSLFIFRKFNIQLVILIYVDDIILTKNSPFVIILLILCLHQSFAMKDLETLYFFLGIQVHHKAIGLHLSQSNYITEILD